MQEERETDGNAFKWCVCVCVFCASTRSFLLKPHPLLAAAVVCCSDPDGCEVDFI